MRSCWIFQPTGAYTQFSTLAASSHRRLTGAGNTHHRHQCVLQRQSNTKWKPFGSIEAVPSETWNIWSSGWGTPTLHGNHCKPERLQQRPASRIPRGKWSTHLLVDGTGVRRKETEEGRIIACLLCFLFPVYVLFHISCYCRLFCRVVYVVGEGADFVKRGVVVGGGFRPLRALRTLHPAGCLEFG